MVKRQGAQSIPCPDAIVELVERFADQHDSYKQLTYNETQVRREFIDPLFAALGWDVDNRAGHAEAYKDVIHEDAIKIGGTTKAPDYCFRIGGVRKFFVEAKKPAIGVKDDPGPAYQLRRYAWTNKLPLSIVTDFEEFAVYDCRIKPNPADKSSTARVLYLTYDQYADRWGDIASIFAKDAILTGSFDRYAESNKRKRGTAEVDAEFLKELETWREELARNIALRNPNLSVRDLNYAVTKTIDRIIFLRMCEDRGVETYAQLQTLPNAPNIYARLVELFRRADERYNSGLFHFEHEKDRSEAPDQLTPNLTVDDKVLKDIIQRLYYPQCPYEFSVLPAEILGQAYEQFLGKVIRLTKGHRAVVEEKPEVRKAGGVYYTPKYIVDYIVEHTVGKLLEERVPGVGIRGSEVGSEIDGDEGDGDQALSRSGRVAESDGSGGAGLPGREVAADGGALRADQPDAAGGRVDSGEHRGGARQDAPGRLPPSSIDRPGVAGGTGDAPGPGGAFGPVASRASSAHLGPMPKRRTASKRSHRRTSKGGRAPGPEALAPISALRVLDPACGSGSFLLGAYQYLLDWHLKWYMANDPESWARLKNPPIYQIEYRHPGPEAGGQGPGVGIKVRDEEEHPGSRVPDPGSPAPDPRPPAPNPGPPAPSYRLTVAERKRILLNNIYGVDIDSQAVEVTKLSLLLKVLEGENRQSLDNQLRLFHERALPDLGDNIKCGNSLIGPDFHDGKQLDLLDEEEYHRINAFDWHAEFPDIMGPPPGPRSPIPDPHFGFDAVIGNPPWGQKDIEKDARLKEYLRSTYSSLPGIFDLFRPFLEQGIDLTRSDGSFGMVLPDILLLKDYEETRRELLNRLTIERIDWWGMAFQQAVIDAATLIGRKNPAPQDHTVVAIIHEGKSTFVNRIPQQEFRRNERLTFNLFLTAEKRSILDVLGRFPKLGEHFEIHEGVHSGNIRQELFVDRRVDRSCRELLFGRNEIAPYVFKWNGKYVRLSAVPQKRTASRYANAGQPRWYEQDKILVRRTGDYLLAALDLAGRYASNNFFVVFPIVALDLDLFGVCAVLNSGLMTWYFRTIEPRVGRVFAELKIKHLRTFPLPRDPETCGWLNEMARKRWQAGNRLLNATTPHAIELARRDCRTLDERINALVLSGFELDETQRKCITMEKSDVETEETAA